MAELKIYLPDDLDARFRKAAMTAYGYGRGSLSKAATEALADWCAAKESNQSREGTSENRKHEETPRPEQSSIKASPDLLSAPKGEPAPVAGGT